MTTSTENLGLVLYDEVDDASKSFLNFRKDMSGTNESNMKKLDEFAGATNEKLIKLEELLGEGAVELKAFQYFLMSDSDAQTEFEIPMETFDAANDVLFVYNGITNAFPEVDYTVSGRVITLAEGVPAGTTIGIRVLRNIQTTEAGVQAENARLSAVSAEASKNAAKTSEGNAKNSEQGAKESENNAAKSAEQATKAAGEATGAVAKAMQEAKESGLFDGEKGNDGTSVTVKNVSESTADGGSNVVTFSDGKTVTIKNGSKGSNGDKGDSPIRGTDYWTEEDKAEMIELVIAAMNGVVYGAVDSDNTIVLAGLLDDGTYTVKYEMSDGTIVEIGKLSLGDEVSEIIAIPWKENYYINSNATTADKTDSNYVSTAEFIPIETGYTYTLHKETAVGISIYVLFYSDADYTTYISRMDSNGNSQYANGEPFTIVPADGANYMRFRCAYNTSDHSDVDDVVLTKTKNS